jgi:2-octaprenyl-6-methoxyphenol hydroxylase
MASSDYQVVIAGGGMVGISLALSLVTRVPDCRILLIESFRMPGGSEQEFARYSPSFDARSTALSYASCLIYRELGLWEDIAERAQPIRSIHVSDQGRFGSTLMQAEEYGWPALGYVAENAWLGLALARALRCSRVELRSPASVTGVTCGDGGAELQLDNGECISTQLLVVADGARSSLRDQLGIGCREHRYEQHAIIANIGHRRHHEGRAYERFTPRGPLAMLPLPEASGARHRSALVWTLPPGEADELKEARDAEFLDQLQEEFGYRLGRLEQVGERHCYPLTLVETEEQARSGVVVMGNAAHALHPVAGQGFNLALRDVTRFCKLLQQAFAADGSPGDLALLEQYRAAQAGDQQLTTAFSDRLPNLFMNGDAAVGLFRDLGLFALDLTPGLKQEFVRQTAGLAASAAYRDVQP